jgi:hypothetical protein
MVFLFRLPQTNNSVPGIYKSLVYFLLSHKTNFQDPTFKSPYHRCIPLGCGFRGARGRGTFQKLLDRHTHTHTPGAARTACRWGNAADEEGDRENYSTRSFVGFILNLDLHILYGNHGRNKKYLQNFG